MSGFRDISIRRKLLLLTMSITAAALASTGIGVVAIDSWLFREALKTDLSALARIIADNSTAALAFDDPRVAAETLQALRARRHLVAACTWRTNGSLLGQYSREPMSGNAGTLCPPVSARDELRTTGSDLIISHAVILEGSRVGTLTIRYDLNEISERRRIYSTAVLGVLLVSICLAFILSARLRSVIATPLAQLVQATKSVSATGDYSVRARRYANDEIGLLVERFNDMLAGIQSRDDNLQKVLREREEALLRFRFLAESMPQKIFTATSAGDIDYLNRQWMEFTGRPFEEMRDWGWTHLVHPDDLSENIRVWRQSLDTGEPFHMEHRFQRADGVYRWHLSRAHAMKDTSGFISMWIGSNTEIHEQKVKEEELRRANDDLQQFAYSASHDLQEPVRNVSIYSELVATRYENLLDEEGKMFLGYLREGGRRLATLVTDLLAYTRAGVTEDHAVDGVPAETVLKNIVSDLAEAIRESGGIITHDPLPDVFMAEAHLRQVLQNLITNALKYRGTEPPRVHISAVLEGSAWRFSVTDNGIGIAPQYRERIFGVFKRLHRDQRYTGTGIGLAICKRVVELYGGRIWVQSVAGAGSCFCFTVPGRSAEDPPPGR